MTKQEINEKIYSLKNDEEIIVFVNDRINFLENNSTEKTVGQGYTDTFKDYISNKIHYKPAAKLKNSECPDLVYDDITPYIELIKSIKKDAWYNELTLFTKIFFTVYNYLPNDDIGLGRALTYMNNKDKRISITEIRENSCGFCSEKTGLAHNLFKFLGIDSEVACGYRDSERHAYNIIYPNGYGNEPIVIYDTSFFVNFVKGNDKMSFGYFKALRKKDYEKLISGIPIKIDLSNTEKNYRNLYGIDDDYVFEGEEPTYSLGLNKENTISDMTDELYYATHLENGVETLSQK